MRALSSSIKDIDDQMRVGYCYRQGIALEALGEPERALSLASQYQELVPDSIRGRKLLSFIRLQQGKYEGVSLLLDPVLQANADDPGALTLMANAMLQENNDYYTV